MLSAALKPHRREFARAVRNHQYEKSPGGILFPKMGAMLAGHFDSWVNGKDHQSDPNIIPTEGLNHILNVILHGVSPVSPWYVAPFSANVTPLITLTGANFTANQTEMTTSYSETNRVTYNEDAAAAGVLSNDTNRAEFSIVSSLTVYGAGLLSTQAKSNAAGVLLACALFSAGRAVVNGDTLQVKYTITAANPA